VEGVEEHDRARVLTELLRERNTLIQLTESDHDSSSPVGQVPERRLAALTIGAAARLRSAAANPIVRVLESGYPRRDRS
jgi:hypothetical protein